MQKEPNRRKKENANSGAEGISEVSHRDKADVIFRGTRGSGVTPTSF